MLSRAKTRLKNLHFVQKKITVNIHKGFSKNIPKFRKTDKNFRYIYDMLFYA